jgi:hypothetical protein
MESSCKHRSEPSVSIEFWGTLAWLHNWLPLLSLAWFMATLCVPRAPQESRFVVLSVWLMKAVSSLPQKLVIYEPSLIPYGGFCKEDVFRISVCLWFFLNFATKVRRVGGATLITSLP